MSYYTNHTHTKPPATPYQRGGSSQQYGAIVGTVVQDSEHPITGHSGDHLQFFIDIGNGVHYQVDVNTQSSTGTEIEVYIADEALTSTGSPTQPFGAPEYGVISNAQLSYTDLGLRDYEFDAQPYYRVDSQLDAALQASTFVAIYGQLFDDGGENGKGIHETHYTGKPNEDGAIAIYSKDDTGALTRTWYFFKFQEDRIGA